MSEVENTGFKSDQWDHGYAIFVAEGVLELQRIDDCDKFGTDDDAIEQFKQDLLEHDSYAMDCLLELIQDYVARDGKGRNGDLHDMDRFNIWDSVP